MPGGTGLRPAPQRAAYNHIVNGGMEVVQRGAGPFTADLAYTHDRWQIKKNAGTSTFSVAPETTVIDARSAQSLKNVYGHGSAIGAIEQKIEHWAQLKGETVTFSIRMRQTVASGAAAYIADGVGTTIGATVTTTGAFVTLTITRTLSASATTLLVGVLFSVSGTYYLDNATLCLGDRALDYEALPPEDDLRRCLRYYEVHGGYANALIVRAVDSNGAGRFFNQSMRYYVPKGGTPTVTKNGTWTVSNCGQPAAGSVSADGYDISSTTTAGGSAAFNCAGASTTITVEWNP